jgi:hypothetical protein
MFSLAVNFGPTGVAWSFLFTKQETLDQAIKGITEAQGSSSITVSDDFGSSAVITMPVHGYLIENMELTKGAIVYRNMHHKRIEAEFASQFQNDPALARLRGEQSAILSPFPRSGRAS